MTEHPSKSSLEKLTDHALLHAFRDLVQRDRDRTAGLLRHIDAIDRRKLWARQGHPSMFDFLVARYHMSESTAGKRIGAARTARRFPVLFTMVARGEIHLSAIHRLKTHLTPANHAGVLAEAKHKTMKQIDELVARLAPQPDAPSRLRALPARTTAPPAAPTTPALTTPALTTPAPTTPAPTTPSPTHPAPRPARAPDPAPLSPGRYKLQVTLDQAAKDKLEQLQDLLAHQIPNGDPAAIIERAIDVLWARVHKRRTGITAKPRASRPTTRRTRHVNASARREVWPRDDARCGFVGEDGRRCNATRGLEFAHVHPYAKGGDTTAPNLALRCPAHNALEADRDYGAGFMARQRERRRDKKPLKVREPIARYEGQRLASSSPQGFLSGPRTNVRRADVRAAAALWESGRVRPKGGTARARDRESTGTNPGRS